MVPRVTPWGGGMWLKEGGTSTAPFGKLVVELG